MKRFRLSRDQVLGIILLIFSTIVGYNALLTRPSLVQGDPGPVIFPLGLCIILGICSIVLLFRKPEITENDKKKKPFMTQEEVKRMLLIYGIFILFVVLLWSVGYLIAIPVALFIISYLFGRPKNVPVRNSVIYTAIVFAIFYVIYVVLMDSSLPRGFLFV